MTDTPVFFNPAQLDFKPRYEWAFGERLDHPETTARAENIVAALIKNSRFELIVPDEIPRSALVGTHSNQLLTLYRAAEQLPKRQTFYPSVFPQTEKAKCDPNNLQHAGAFCFDSGTPLSRDTWTAATCSAACAYYAAASLKKNGDLLTYALSRPPGHHATKELFGGYCYFNNAAIAARYLRRYGRVALLDVDFHHGNGTQKIFYRDDRVLFLSIHGDPVTSYPFFAGFATETGEGKGLGFNINAPLPVGADGQGYMRELNKKIIPNLKNFAPDFLVLSTGLDAYIKDPVGDFNLTTEDFFDLGNRVGKLKIPTVSVQEGGYYTAHLGRNVEAILLGLRKGLGIDTP